MQQSELVAKPLVRRMESGRDLKILAVATVPIANPVLGRTRPFSTSHFLKRREAREIRDGDLATAIGEQKMSLVPVGSARISTLLAG